MHCQSVYFTAPRQVEVCEEPLPQPANDQALVQTLVSAISPGTEMLIYRGQFPRDLSLDETLPDLSGEFSFPLKYGYSAVGRVVAAGHSLDSSWLGRLVFAFKPHSSHFLARLEELQPIPDDLSPEDAVFLPNMETAVNFLMDGAPIIGEHVTVFGQGIVGLLTTALLSQFPLSSLVTLDRYELRRQASLGLGATISLDPGVSGALAELHSLQPAGADLVYELSGSPVALDQAIAAAGYAGRVIVGSWYGQKRIHLDLGGRFHRSRIRLVSSQVSSVAPELSGRWSKVRRFSLAWDFLRRIRTSRLVTHTFSITDARQAYALLDESPGETIQVLLRYPESGH